MEKDPEADHAGQPKPLFGPPTTKLAYARHLHTDASASEASVAEPHHAAHPSGHEQRQRPSEEQEEEDAQNGYNAVKMRTFHPAEHSASAAGALVMGNGHAHASGDGTYAGEQGAPLHQLGITHPGALHKHPVPSQPETRPLVYIYDLPTPLVNCSRPDWASYIYGSEVRLPEVSSHCESGRHAC